MKSKLHPKQFGFESCETFVLQIIDYLECFYHEKAVNQFLDYFDYEKAFDKVPHSILLRQFSL